MGKKTNKQQATRFQFIPFLNLGSREGRSGTSLCVLFYDAKPRKPVQKNLKPVQKKTKTKNKKRGGAQTSRRARAPLRRLGSGRARRSGGPRRNGPRGAAGLLGSQRPQSCPALARRGASCERSLRTCGDRLAPPRKRLPGSPPPQPTPPRARAPTAVRGAAPASSLR